MEKSKVYFTNFRTSNRENQLTSGPIMPRLWPMLSKAWVENRF